MLEKARTYIEDRAPDFTGGVRAALWAVAGGIIGATVMALSPGVIWSGVFLGGSIIGPVAVMGAVTGLAIGGAWGSLKHFCNRDISSHRKFAFGAGLTSTLAAAGLATIAGNAVTSSFKSEPDHKTSAVIKTPDTQGGNKPVFDTLSLREQFAAPESEFSNLQVTHTKATLILRASI